MYYVLYLRCHIRHIGTYKYNSNVFLLFHAPPLAFISNSLLCIRGKDPVSQDQIYNLRTARAPGIMHVNGCDILMYIL